MINGDESRLGGDMPIPDLHQELREKWRTGVLTALECKSWKPQGRSDTVGMTRCNGRAKIIAFVRAIQGQDGRSDQPPQGHKDADREYWLTYGAGCRYSEPAGRVVT